MEVITQFVDVVVPVPLPGRFTYRVLREQTGLVVPGVRVLVQFGARKVYTGIVVEVHSTPPQGHLAKYLLEVLDASPVVTHQQLEFWSWMAEYYLSTEGEVMQAALPTGMKLSSEQVVCIHPDFDGDISDLDLNEAGTVEAVQNKGSLTLADIIALTGQQNIHRMVAKLVVKSILMYHEEVHERYRPKVEVRIRLADVYEANHEALQSVFDQLKRARKQEELLLTFLQRTRVGGKSEKSIAQKELLDASGASMAVLKQLIDKGILMRDEIEISRLNTTNAWAEGAIELNEGQLKALADIRTAFAHQEVCLLHGVTSSGKTEVFIRLIQELTANGGQILYLLPEIALTTQIVTRLQKHFGAEVGVYHSRMSDNERVEVWQRMAGGTDQPPFKVLLGARSALFLPFIDLKLVVIDEEHDPSYKQHDPSPRYHARDSAIMLARQCGAKVLLGSATPSVEAFFNAKAGKFGLATLTHRFGGTSLPYVKPIDLRLERKEKRMKGPFSETLLQAISTALQKREQIILFQNRRGFSSFVQCADCGHVPQCERCDISLTYHKFSHDLRCHYCGYTKTLGSTCGACGSGHINTKGIGTEQVEEELAIHFPQARTARMDLDTTRAKGAHHRIISDFEDRYIDILVGTQMVTKGLDFGHVGLVGIVNADQMLHHPDFRAFERAFQLMAQVSGRAGRRAKQGLVLIQTSEPQHPVVQMVVNHDHASLHLQEVAQRRHFRYPPFARLVQITVKDRDREKADQTSKYLAQTIKNQGLVEVLGPEVPHIGRIRNFYLKQLMLKIDPTRLRSAKKSIELAIKTTKSVKELRTSIIQVDVDPA